MTTSVGVTREALAALVTWAAQTEVLSAVNIIALERFRRSTEGLVRYMW